MNKVTPITVLVYRRLDNRFEGFGDDSPRALELHNRRRDAVHEVFDAKPGVEVLDWGKTDDTQPHEGVEIVIGIVGAAIFKYVVSPGLNWLGTKLAERAVDAGVTELSKAVISWLRPKQKERQVLDITLGLSLPERISIKVNSPGISPDITIQFADGKVESTTYSEPI